MYHLTKVQHGILRTAAMNLCSVAHHDDQDEAIPYLDILADLVAMLTGEYPDDKTQLSALETARKSASEDAVIGAFIGSFDYPEEP